MCYKMEQDGKGPPNPVSHKTPTQGSLNVFFFQISCKYNTDVNFIQTVALRILAVNQSVQYLEKRKRIPS